MSARAGRTAAVGFAVTAVLLVGLPTSAVTEASFADAEHATATLTAFVVPAPVIDTCVASSLLVSLSLTPRIRITWHYPVTGFTGSDARYYFSSSGILGLASVSLGNGVTTTGPSSGTYTSTFQGSLLGGLLGGTADVGVAAVHSSGWVSLVSSAHGTFPLLIGTGTCTISNS